MTLAPGLQAAVEEVQAIIDAASKHPLYDVFVNIEAMERIGGPEIVISWRGKVEWTHEEYKRRRDAELTKYWRKPAHEWPTDVVSAPIWGNDIAVSVFMINVVPEDVVQSVLRMIDINFLQSLEKNDFTANNWVWSKEARFR